MIIEKINNDGRTKLMTTLEKLTNSFSRRGVSFVNTAHSEFVGQITVMVTGKKGSVQKTILVVFNQKSSEWEGFCDGYIYQMLSITEISTVVKSKISNLQSLLLKV